jgi:hypothetical protein
MTRIKVRRGTSVEWTVANPVLAEGEFGFETNTTKLKIGNGTTAWTGLSYTSLDWTTLANKPAVIAAGATQEAARTAISAAALDSNGYIPLSQWGAQVVDGGTAAVSTTDVINGGTA